MGGSNPKHDHDRTNWQFTKRPDIHMLIVGDPGLGKSQMLHACSMVAPRGTFESLNGKEPTISTKKNSHARVQKKIVKVLSPKRAYHTFSSAIKCYALIVYY